MEPSQRPRTLSGLREVLPDLRGTERSLRVTAHPQQDLVVLSIWREDRCVGTVQVASGDIPALINVLVLGLAEMAPAETTTAARPSGLGPDDRPEHRTSA